MTPPLIRALTDGGAGMVTQAYGLAQKIAALGGCEVAHSIVSAPGAANILPPTLAAELRLYKIHGDAHADMVVCCGAKSLAAALARKKNHGAFAVCIQRPRADAKRFDAIVAPRHDYSVAELCAMEKNPAAKTLPILGATGTIDAEALTARQDAARKRFTAIPAPRTAVLVGGDNRAFSLTPQFCRELAAAALRADPAGGILATASRRTGPEARRALADSFSGDRCFFYDGEGDENPYLDILAAADRLLATSDSVNMLSEACAAAKPVYIAELPLKNEFGRAAKKFRRFGDELVARNLARRWEGEFAEWRPPGLNETARAATFIWNAYRARSGGER